MNSITRASRTRNNGTEQVGGFVANQTSCRFLSDGHDPPHPRLATASERVRGSSLQKKEARFCGGARGRHYPSRTWWGSCFNSSLTRRRPYTFSQPDKALDFYKYVCSYDGEPITPKDALTDNEEDRKIIFHYVQYHYLLSLKDYTASNTLIGRWRKELGYKEFSEDFNLHYGGGRLPMNSDKLTNSPRTHAATRKSTEGIPITKPEEANCLSRRRSEDYHWFHGRLLTPQPSSDGDNTPPPIRSPVSGSNSGLPTGDPNGFSVRDVDQGTSHNYDPQDVYMDAANEPPLTPLKDIGFLVGSPAPETANSATVPAQITWESVDDSMNGTSVSAVCFRSEKEPSQSRSGGGKPHSAPVPPSTAQRRKKRHKANLNPKKKPPKKPNRVDGVTAGQPMSIDTPIVADPGPDSGSPSLELSTHSHTSTTPILQEFRAPFSSSCAHIPLSRSAPGQNHDPLPEDLKELDDTPTVASPGFSRPTLSRNPPIWAQVSMSPGWATQILIDNQSRQELCESCHFFKSYQGGVYFSSGYAKGYLLSCFGAM